VAAEACGLQTETGRLAAGFAADLLVVPGDLSQDVGLLATPLAVLIRGTPVTPAR
jgi:imidazolonepropionase-like amidohydrolase